MTQAPDLQQIQDWHTALIEGLPDYIEVFRIMQATGSTKRRVQAQAVAARIEEFRDAIRTLKEQSNASE